MNNDPYRVLGVSPSATPEEIKKAYREKTKLYHPDLHPDDPNAVAKMSEINEAYDILTDPAKKSRYAYGQNSYASSQNTGYRTNYGSQSQHGYAYKQSYGQNWSGTYWGFNFDDLFGANAYRQTNEEELRPENGDPVELVRAIRHINENRSEEALVELLNMSEAYRNARWYYVCARAYHNLQYYDNALEMIKMAVKLDPDSAQYTYLYQQYSNQTRYHYTADPGYTRSGRVYSVSDLIRKAALYFIGFQVVMWLLRLLFFGFLF